MIRNSSSGKILLDATIKKPVISITNTGRVSAVTEYSSGKIDDEGSAISTAEIPAAGIINGTLGTPEIPETIQKNDSGIEYGDGSIPVEMDAITDDIDGYLKVGSKPQININSSKIYTGGTVTPGTEEKEIAPAGAILAGPISIAGDENLLPENIKKGVSIFGVDGANDGAGYEISLGKNIDDGGSVSGGGTATEGMIVTVKANPDKENDYIFDGWNEGDSLVSGDADYTFIIDKSRELIAKFTKLERGGTWGDGSDYEGFSVVDIDYGNGMFVAVGSDGSAYYSYDGISWNKGGNSVITAYEMSSMIYGKDNFIAMRIDGTEFRWYPNTYRFDHPIHIGSADDPPLHLSQMVTDGNFVDIAYGNGVYVAISSKNNYAGYSRSQSDACQWKSSTLPSDLRNEQPCSWCSVAYGNNMFVAIAENTETFAYSLDGGIEWIRSSLPCSTSWKKIIYGDGRFIAVGNDDHKIITAYSDDGIKWNRGIDITTNAHITDIVYGDETFIMVTDSYNCFVSKDNGDTWVNFDLPYSDDWRIAYGNGRFVALGSDHAVICSSKQRGMYSLTINSDPEAAGTIEGEGQYLDGSYVRISAVAKEAYKFIRWDVDGELLSYQREYTFQIDRDMVVTAVFEERETYTRLPEGYVEVEYIQSNGTQSIDAAVKPTNTNKPIIEMDVEPTAASTEYTVSNVVDVPGLRFYHAFYNQGSYTYALIATWSTDGIYSGMGRTTVSGSRKVSTTRVSTDTTLRRINLIGNGGTGKITIDGEEKTGAVSTTLNYVDIRTIYLLGDSSAHYLPAKLYSCKIITDDEVVRNFVPCINPDKKVGLYDLVSNEFYGAYKDTADPFVAGDPVILYK